MRLNLAPGSVQDGDTCIVTHWRKVLAAKGLLDEQVKVLMPVVFRCSNHFNTNTKKALDKIRQKIGKMGSKSEGAATEAQFKEVNRRHATFTKPVLPKYDHVVAQAGGEPAEGQDARFGALREAIACHLCGDHSLCKQARDGMRQQLGARAQLSPAMRCLSAI